MSQSEYAGFEPAAPYFDLVLRALGDLVDGQHFFDAVADGIVYEVRYDIPGWPRTGDLSRTSLFVPPTS